MPSENARAVAQEIIATVRKGEKVNKGKILRKHGYSKHVSRQPTKVTETQSFKDVIDPVAKAMMRERDAAIALLSKRIDKAKYRDLVDGIDKLTKNVQLLTGGNTSNDKIKFGWED